MLLKHIIIMIYTHLWFINLGWLLWLCLVCWKWGHLGYVKSSITILSLEQRHSCYPPRLYGTQILSLPGQPGCSTHHTLLLGMIVHQYRSKQYREFYYLCWSPPKNSNHAHVNQLMNDKIDDGKWQKINYHVFKWQLWCMKLSNQHDHLTLILILKMIMSFFVVDIWTVTVSKCRNAWLTPTRWKIIIKRTHMLKQTTLYHTPLYCI